LIEPTLGDYLLDQSKQFSDDAVFNSGINPKDKVTLGVSTILSQMLVVTAEAEFFMEHQTKLHHAEQYRIMTYLPDAFR